jgi:hypothetical protein
MATGLCGPGPKAGDSENGGAGLKCSFKRIQKESDLEEREQDMVVRRADVGKAEVRQKPWEGIQTHEIKIKYIVSDISNDIRSEWELRGTTNSWCKMLPPSRTFSQHFVPDLLGNIMSMHYKYTCRTGSDMSMLLKFSNVLVRSDLISLATSGVQMTVNLLFVCVK